MQFFGADGEMNSISPWRSTPVESSLRMPRGRCYSCTSPRGYDADDHPAAHDDFGCKDDCDFVDGDCLNKDFFHRPPQKERGR